MEGGDTINVLSLDILTNTTLAMQKVLYVRQSSHSLLWSIMHNS